MIRLFFVACLAALVVGHPTKYPNIAPWKVGDAIPPFRSYHIHNVFVAYQKDAILSAFDLRQRFIEHFNLTDVRVCEGDFDQGRLCMFEIMYNNDGPDDPFISGNWAVYLPLEWFEECVPWVMQNRGDQTIFVHPNSGAEVSDHMRWSTWMGPQWAINTDSFTNQTMI